MLLAVVVVVIEPWLLCEYEGSMAGHIRPLEFYKMNTLACINLANWRVIKLTTIVEWESIMLNAFVCGNVYGVI